MMNYEMSEPVGNRKPSELNHLRTGKIILVRTPKSSRPLGAYRVLIPLDFIIHHS